MNPYTAIAAVAKNVIDSEIKYNGRLPVNRTKQRNVIFATILMKLMMATALSGAIGLSYALTICTMNGIIPVIPVKSEKKKIDTIIKSGLSVGFRFNSAHFSSSVGNEWLQIWSFLRQDLHELKRWLYRCISWYSLVTASVDTQPRNQLNAFFASECRFFDRRNCGVSGTYKFVRIKRMINFTNYSKSKTHAAKSNHSNYGQKHENQCHSSPWHQRIQSKYKKTSRRHPSTGKRYQYSTIRRFTANWMGNLIRLFSIHFNEFCPETYEISAMYVIVGELLKPFARPINEYATNISQTLLELYIINHEIRNGTFAAIIARFRPNKSTSKRI